MMQAMGLRSPAPVQSRLRHLQQKGWLTWQEGQARTLQLLGDVALGIPVLGAVAAGGLAAAAAVPGSSTLVIPQTITLNFQSGIAEDTLLFGSIHQADWDNAQINIPANAATGAIAVGSSFTSKTSYSVGLGRKISDDLSLIASYSTEDGGGSTSTDPFTLTDGYQTLGVAARYTRDNMTFTAGYGYTKVGDVLVSYDLTALGMGVLTADYKDNDISAIGVKIGFSF